MSKFKAKAKKIAEVAGLKWKPIAGRFSSHPDKAADSSRKLSICDALNLIKRRNLVLSISKENCACAGGRHFTGLEIVPLERIAPAVTTKRHRVYESTKIALDSISKQPQPVNRGEFLTLGPLEKFETDPDFVFLIANPAQADRILGLISFMGAEPFTYYPSSSICSTITNVLAKGRPEINLISFFERRAGKWSPNELVLAIPLKDFEAAMENISHSGYGHAETSKT